MKQKDFDASIDIYSFGIVLWEIYVRIRRTAHPLIGG